MVKNIPIYNLRTNFITEYIFLAAVLFYILKRSFFASVFTNVSFFENVIVGDFFLLVTFITLLFYRRKFLLKWYFLDKASIYVIMFFIWSIISHLIMSIYYSGQENNYNISHMYFRKFISGTILAYLLGYLIVNSNTRLYRLIIVIMVPNIVLGVSIILGLGFLSTTVGAMHDVEYDQLIDLPFAFSMDIGPNSTSLLFLMIAIVAFAHLYLSRDKIVKFISIGIFVFSIVVMILLATRATLLALPVGILLIILYSTAKKQRTIISVGPTLLFYLFIVFIAFNFLYNNWYSISLYLGQAQFAKLNTLFGNDNLLNVNSVDIRLSQYPVFFESLLFHPFGLGFFELYPIYSVQPHSWFLRIASSTGFVGLVLFFLFIFSLLKKFITNRSRLNEANRPIVISLISVIFTLLLLGWGYDFVARPHIQLPFYALLGALSRLVDENNQMQKSIK